MTHAFCFNPSAASGNVEAARQARLEQARLQQARMQQARLEQARARLQAGRAAAEALEVRLCSVTQVESALEL